MNIKKIKKEIEELTILYQTAREEGSEEEHKEVVEKLLNLFKKYAHQHCEKKLKAYKEYLKIKKTIEKAYSEAQKLKGSQ